MLTIEEQATAALVADLQKAIGVEQVRFDRMTRLLYSTDASNYQIMPVGVTFPRAGDDVAAIHTIAHQHKMPVLPRGAGSSLAGQTVGKAVVMDFSRHLHHVHAIDPEARTVMTDPGIALDLVSRQTARHGLMYGPDPASADRATVGGCIGNNATGSHSILYGMFADHISRLEVVLASGERVWLDADNDSLNPIRALVADLATQHADEIRERYPKTWRTCAGYAHNKLDPAAVNLNWLFAGSEGTLGTIIQAELNLVPRPKMKQLALVHFSSIRESLEATPRILETDPSAVELMDRFLLNKTRANTEFAPLLTFVDGDPEAILAVEYYGESESDLAAKVETLKKLLITIRHHGAVIDAVSPAEQARVWKVRKAGLGLLMSERRAAKPIPFIEDVAVPVDKLADYVSDVEAVIHEAGVDFAIYAHASAGCLHVRPVIDLRTQDGYRQYRGISDGVVELVKKYGGTISGEHGQGYARGEYTERLFGSQLTAAFQAIKTAFDPDNLMNPGKIIGVRRMDDASLMRYTPEYSVILPKKTRYDWSHDDGFNGAVEMCNGSGVCRKEGAGTMCPSYMATRDEAHSTRGRANALRQAMAGELGEDGLSSEELHEVFELCLSCKSCKSECPSSVDVARMKAEFTAQYDDVHGIPLRSRIFANIHRLNRLGSIWPAFSNFMLGTQLAKWAFALIGIPSDRPLPRFAPRRFSKTTSKVADPQATLIIDTYVEYNHPEIGAAVLDIACALGLRLNAMRLPGQGCCGRPALSMGVVDPVKRMAARNITELHRKISFGPFLFLEPSCMSAFTDDYPALVDPELREAALEVAAQCQSVEGWLAEQFQTYDHLPWDNQPRQIMLHGHCHQKSLWGTDDTMALLRSIPNATVTEIDSGCCGVAGAFGYLHYDLSMKIGNQRLLPTIAEHPEALVVAPGTSCRTQISEAGYPVWHPVQIVAQALTHSSTGSADGNSPCD